MGQKDPERWRLQAEEMRVKAELMSDETARSQYVRMAEAYDTMAENADRATAPPGEQKLPGSQQEPRARKN